jgi:serine/threonine protein phosphatase 1
VRERTHGQERFNIFVSNWEDAPGRLPPGATVCAIGDVHGQADHLAALVGWVDAQVLSAASGGRHLVLLGDYVDRGPRCL